MTADGLGKARDDRSDGYPPYVAKKIRAKGLKVKSGSVPSEVEPSKNYYLHDKTDKTTVFSEPTKYKSDEGGHVGRIAVT